MRWSDREIVPRATRQRAAESWGMGPRRQSSTSSSKEQGAAAKLDDDCLFDLGEECSSSPSWAHRPVPSWRLRYFATPWHLVVSQAARVHMLNRPLELGSNAPRREGWIVPLVMGAGSLVLSGGSVRLRQAATAGSLTKDHRSRVPWFPGSYSRPAGRPIRRFLFHEDSADEASDGLIVGRCRGPRCDA